MQKAPPVVRCCVLRTPPVAGKAGSSVACRVLRTLPVACCALLLLAGCRKPAPAVAAPAAPARFCDRDLSGVWTNASDRHFAYRFRDHGGVLRGEYLIVQDDGGLQDPPEPILFELHRTDSALAGVMKATGPAPSGRVCPVEFGITVSSCEPGAMVAVVETEVPITDACTRKLRGEDGGEIPPALVEFRFERLHPSGG